MVYWYNVTVGTTKIGSRAGRAKGGTPIMPRGNQKNLIPGGSFNYERAARALVDASFKGDKNSARIHGLSTRTIRTYRKRAETDSNLSELFREKLRIAESDWSAEVSPAIRSVIAFIRDVAENGRRDPETLHAVNSSLTILIESDLTRRLLDEKLKQMTAPDVKQD